MSNESWERVLDAAFDDPSGRIVDLHVDEHDIGGERVGVVSLRFTAEDLRGEEYVASATVYLPDSLVGGAVERLPVWFNCGYQLDVAHVPRQLRCGRIVVTSIEPQGSEVFPHASPLARGPNTDYVLAHLVRGARFADPAKIVYGGGSAGGYAALLVAAEAFPAPVTVPNVPVVNLVYEGAYCMTTCPRVLADPPAEYPLMSMLMAGFVQLAEDGWGRCYGADVSAPGWFEHSPVAHLDRITGPVAACFSTADFLVPIEQVGAAVAAPTLADLPANVVMAASELTSEPRAAVRLVDALGDAADVRVVGVPGGAKETRMDQLDLTMSTPQIPLPVPASTSNGEQWLVTVVDEGPTVMGIGHTRHGFEPDFEAFIGHHLDDGIGVEQLTSAKLEQLVDRWAGTEWLAPGFHHLDRPAAERADVQRGLRLYCAVSSAHAQRFADLYAQLPDDRRLLPGDLVAELANASRAT
ncbi:MAG: hypothetical protein WAS51_01965 [Ilumatobacteraceae bacterium]